MEVIFMFSAELLLIKASVSVELKTFILIGLFLKRVTNGECKSRSNPDRIWLDQGRPLLACGRQTGERDLLVLLLGPVCVVDGAAPSMLIHRETAVTATLSRGVKPGWWLQLPKNGTAKANPTRWVCVCVPACAFMWMCGHTAFVCLHCVCVCVSVLTAKKPQQHLTWQLFAAFSPALSSWLTFLWYYLFIQSHVYKWRLTAVSYRTRELINTVLFTEK